jgi:uncharacterized protein (DUF2141 family)
MHRKKGLLAYRRAMIEILEHRTLLSAGQITASVYNDLNGDGIHTTNEPGLANQTVFLDSNNNGVLDENEPTQMTNASGQATFGNLAAGTYHVRVVIPTGWISMTGNTAVNVNLSSGQSAQAAIELVKPVDWSNLIYNDLNFNGLEDKSDPGLAGAEMYIDANNNGILDLGEPTATTDSNGILTFHGLLPGKYTLHTFIKPGWQETDPITSEGLTITSGATPGKSPLGEILTSSLCTAIGNVFNDFNGNGVQDANEPTLGGGWTVYIDSNNNGQYDSTDLHANTNDTGTFKFQITTPGTFFLNIAQKSGWRATTPVTRTFTAQQGKVTPMNFGFQNLAPGIAGTVYNDLNTNTELNATDTRLPNVRVFLDLNKNGVLDAGEPSTLTDSIGNFQFSGLASGTYRLTQVTPAGLSPYFPVQKYSDLTVASTQRVTQNMGDVKTLASVSFSGTVFNDLNGDKTRESGEAGLSGWSLYLDLNLDSVRESNEPVVTTNSAGVYTFSNMRTGRYLIRPLPPSGWRTINFVAWWASSLGNNVTGLDFAASHVGKIGGKVYIDANDNLKNDPNETPLAGFMVYIDSNKDGKFEVGELYSVTNSFGAFFWDGLAPGTYTIRVQTQPGYTLTTPASYAITVGQGQFVTGFDFGLKT